MQNNIEQNLQLQKSILYQEKITSEANRRGLRKITGDLLEAAFIELVIRLQPGLSIEIGAHEASYSQRVKHALPDTKVIAFEANPFVYQKYVDTFTETIDYQHLAIADVDGEIELQIPVSLNGDSIIKANPISSVLSRVHTGFASEAVVVPCKTLDGVTCDMDSTGSVAWVDVEGAQAQVIAGGQRCLSQATAIYIELEHHEVWQGQGVATDIIGKLAESGLELLMLDNLADGQYNAVFIRPSVQNKGVVEAVARNYIQELSSL